MFLKSHHWVYRPHYASEIFREMRVRESKHTVMLWDQKKYDYETGKFKFDSLTTLNTHDWTEDMSDHSDSYMRARWGAYVEELRDNRDYKLTGKKKKYKPKNVQDYYINNEDEYVKIPRHIPKDDDFDKEELGTKKQNIEDKNNIDTQYHWPKVPSLEVRSENLRIKAEEEKKKRTEQDILGEIRAKQERDRLRMPDDIRNMANKLSGFISLKRAQEKRYQEQLKRREAELEKEREKI